MAAQQAKLLWADEFDQEGLPNPKNWSYDVGDHGWGNNELQYYTPYSRGTQGGQFS